MEADVIKKLSRGDHSSFELLYNQYSSKVFFVAKKFGLSQEDSEGIVQDVFIKIWEKRKKLKPELSINAYLLTITKNLIIKKARGNAFSMAAKNYLSLTSSSSHNHTEEALVYADLFNVTENFINELPEQQREIFRLSKLQHLPHKEIAKQLNISVRTVETHLFRANTKLKKQLSALGIGSDNLFLIILLLCAFSN